jgi:aspartyl protease family protein
MRCGVLIVAAIEPMRSVLTFTALALACGMIVPHYAAQYESAHRAPDNLMVARQTTAAVPQPASASNSVIVPRDAFGHFRTEGRIDGRRVAFLIDTGATIIALTAEDAGMMGIHPGNSEYSVLLKTANGLVRAAPTTLDMVEVGDIMVRDVPAVVMPDGALSENLLGMSFLSRLRHFEYSDGNMVLAQ